MRLNAQLAIAITVAFIYLGQASLAAGDMLARCRGISQIDLSNQKTTDGASLIGKALDKAYTLNDYSYDCVYFSFKDPKPKQSGAKVYFKKPNLVRLEVATHDFRNGSVITRGADGKIRLAGGGMLGSMKMNLDEDSRFLKLPSGANAIKSDFVTVLSNIKSTSNNGGYCKASAAPMTVNAVDGVVAAYVLDSYIGQGDKGVLTERILINPDTFLPIEWAHFTPGGIRCTVVFHNLIANKGLNNDLFRL